MTKIFNAITSFLNDIFSENESIGLSSLEPIKNETKNQQTNEPYDTSIYNIFK